MNIADIQAETRLLCDADSTSYPDAALLRRENSALETIVGKIINADGMYQWDDTNYTDLPRGTGNLVEGQSVYSFASEYLQILEMDVKDVNGNWSRLKPLDHNELDGLTPEEYFGHTSGTITTGMPTHYDLFADDSFRLYPTPTATAVTLTAGYRIWFKRTADIFTSAQVTTGTKVPGIPSPFHPLICYMSAIPYCMSYKKDRVALYEKRVMEMTDDLLKHYASRDKDKRKIMTMKKINFI